MTQRTDWGAWNIKTMENEIMDYEKKYNEALEWMREIYPTMEGFVKEDAEHYFPELKENEDEKIRKFIIGCIDELRKANAENAEFNGECSEALSYLEKQKEQKPELPLMNGDADLYFDEWRQQYQGSPTKRECFEEGIEYAQRLQKEQKPAEQLGGTFTSYDIAKTFTEGQNYVIAHPEKFGLCKPAEWSEEDETAFGDLMWCIEQARKSAKDENDMGNIWFAENWVKKRIKSLRPQPHWKPSEEQMDHLAYAYTQLKLQKCYAPHVYESLGSLYDDLKKLI